MICGTCKAEYNTRGMDTREREDAYNVHTGSQRHRDALASAREAARQRTMGERGMPESEARAMWGDR